VVMFSGVRAARRAPFNARKVESLVTWLYTSIVTAIWLSRRICMATRGWT
jgi:hypothetical protein